MSDIITATEATCTICGKKFEKEPLIVLDWDLCPECRKTYGGMALVFCYGCNAVVTRVKPGFYKDLLVKSGDILHIRECPKCNPKVTRSNFIELENNEKN